MGFPLKILPGQLKKQLQLFVGLNSVLWISQLSEGEWVERKTKGHVAAKRKPQNTKKWKLKAPQMAAGTCLLSVHSSSGFLVSCWFCSRQWELKAVTVLQCFSAVGPNLGENERWPAAVGTGKLWCYLPPVSWSQAIICHMRPLCERVRVKWSQRREARPLFPGEPHGVQVGSRAGLAAWEGEESINTFKNLHPRVCVCVPLLLPSACWELSGVS